MVKKRLTNEKRLEYLNKVVLFIPLDSTFDLVISPLNVHVVGNWYSITLYQKEPKEIYGNQFEPVKSPPDKELEKTLEEFGKIVEYEREIRKMNLKS